MGRTRYRIPKHWEHFLFGSARPQRVLRLQGGDRMDSVSPTDRPAQASDRPMCRILPSATSRKACRRSLRSASAGRCGAGSRDRCSRCRDAAAIPRPRRRMFAGLLSRPGAAPGQDTKPNSWRARPGRDGRGPGRRVLHDVTAVDLGRVEEVHTEVERAVEAAGSTRLRLSPAPVYAADIPIATQTDTAQRPGHRA